MNEKGIEQFKHIHCDQCRDKNNKCEKKKHIEACADEKNALDDIGRIDDGLMEFF